MGIFKLALRTQVQRFWLWEPPQVMDLRVLMFEYVFSLSVIYFASNNMFCLF